MKALLLFLALLSPALAAEKPNVLFLLVDDLKPALGCYGDKLAITPNIDRLAARGVRFDLAYCNQAVCAASRTALLLGSRPSSTGLHGLSRFLRDSIPDAVTLPQHFMVNGYRVEGIGKIFHTGHGNKDDAASWSVPWTHQPVVEYLLPASTGGGNLTREEAYFSNQRLGDIGALPKGAAIEIADVPDNAYADGRTAEQGIQRLQAAAKRAEPFFIALGFAKPHLPFTAPKKYFDLHDKAKFSLPAFTTPPQDAPAIAGKKGGEITNYEPVPNNGKVSDELARDLIHAYYSAATFADTQIGKVLDELQRLGLEKNTIVVLWGDHGWHLGDHGFWTKHTNYEQANRIPVIIAAPGIAPGVASRQLLESVDLFPTLAELAGLPAPRGPQPIDGLSLVPVLRDPAKVVRDYAYHCYPRPKLMGRAIRTARYRFVEWKVPGEPADTALLELYDYEKDPLETQNLAAAQPEVVAQLRTILAKQPEALLNPPPREKPAP
ncbi:MAG: sulfatase [Chthoniobacter sp.]|nr:sulfatase [Chthoniobacter sp.]